MAKEKNINGAGCIFYSESGKKWIAKLNIGKDSKGKPIIKQFSSTKSRRAVEKSLENFKKNYYSGRYSTNTITLNGYIEYWLYTFQRPSVKITTFNRDVSTYETHIKYTIGHNLLKDITTYHIQSLINSEIDRYANKTIEKTYSLLNRVFKHAVNTDELYKNPCNGVRLPSIHSNSIKPRDIQIYSIEETNKIKLGIVDSWENHKHIYRASPSYIILVNTGMRIGELLALKWDNVDLKANLIRIKESQVTAKVNGKRKNISMYPKTKSSYRTIPINNTCKEMLLELKRRNEVQNIKSEFVVCNIKGESFNDNNYRRDFKRFCKRYDITYKALHNFRHTFATRLFDNDVETINVSKLLGHYSTAITQNVYIHILAEQQTKAIALLDDI